MAVAAQTAMERAHHLLQSPPAAPAVMTCPNHHLSPHLQPLQARLQHQQTQTPVVMATRHHHPLLLAAPLALTVAAQVRCYCSRLNSVTSVQWHSHALAGTLTKPLICDVLSLSHLPAAGPKLGEPAARWLIGSTAHKAMPAVLTRLHS